MEERRGPTSHEAKKIRISTADLEYLKSTGFLSPRLTTILDGAEKDGMNHYALWLTEPVTNEFRDELTMRLAMYGFDEDYRTNEEGKRLEDLIADFFFVTAP